MPPCFSVVNLREIGGRKEAQAGKNFSEASDRVGAILTTVAAPSDWFMTCSDLSIRANTTRTKLIHIYFTLLKIFKGTCF